MQSQELLAGGPDAASKHMRISLVLTPSLWVCFRTTLTCLPINRGSSKAREALNASLRTLYTQTL